ncbi:MAG: hypothetical protein KAT79_06745 [candidate division Zixibacteria bacterium]|nr:hypothetical protein [candidate division Zixibacteria bacterium]
MSDWLPQLILMSSYGNNWSEFLDAIYRFFKKDYMYSKPSFNGEHIGHKRHPAIQGKEATFWHLISEGSNESERVPEIRRCERIRWPRAVIDNCGDPDVKVWENSRRGECRVVLWFEKQNYVVVLARRKDYLLLWTAYPVVRVHRKEKLRKEYENSLKG